MRLSRVRYRQIPEPTPAAERFNRAVLAGGYGKEARRQMRRLMAINRIVRAMESGRPRYRVTP